MSLSFSVGVGKPRLSVMDIISQPDRRDIPDTVGQLAVAQLSKLAFWQFG